MSNTQHIFLPKLGESTMEATIIEWHKEIGDFIELDEDLVTIGTDKVDSELPSEFKGKLTDILVQAGETVKVGEPIAIIQIQDARQEIQNIRHETKEQNEVSLNQFEEERPNPDNRQLTINNHKPATKNKLPKTHDKKFLSPVVRKIAVEHGLTLDDLNKIEGSGLGNRIKKSDILSYLTPLNLTKKRKNNLNIQANDTVHKLSRIRSLAATHLLESYQNIPHVTTFSLVDVTQLVASRNSFKAKIQTEKGLKVTYTHLMMFLMIENLKRFSKFNAWMNGDELIIKHDINLGFATATKDGNLLVPNIRQANNITLWELAERIQSVGLETKKKLTNPDLLKDTTFTMSNTGVFGSLMGTPIISQPQVAIIALGEINSTPSVIIENGKEVFTVRKKMYLSLSYDHRVIDGALASKFLTSYKNLLEQTDFNELLKTLI